MPSPFTMIWDGCRHQRPEFLAVAGMFQVSQLMHDHVLESGYGKPHQGRVESDRPGSVIARTPSGTHSAISDQGWLRHPHDRHPRVEQWPGNAFHFTASEHGDGSFPGHFTRPRNYQPMAGNPGTSPASSPVLHVLPSAPQPGPPPVLEPVGLTGRFSQLLALPIYPGPLFPDEPTYPSRRNAERGRNHHISPRRNDPQTDILHPFPGYRHREIIHLDQTVFHHI